ncbi:hypothetical protein CZ774_05675 [Frigoribacterium sp. JB110]|nr:hypothetical protein CZ774_05675 [Frigoribacterium sp. JB110]
MHSLLSLLTAQSGIQPCNPRRNPLAGRLQLRVPGADPFAGWIPSPSSRAKCSSVTVSPSARAGERPSSRLVRPVPIQVPGGQPDSV